MCFWLVLLHWSQFCYICTQIQCSVTVMKQSHFTDTNWGGPGRTNSPRAVWLFLAYLPSKTNHSIWEPRYHYLDPVKYKQFPVICMRSVHVTAACHAVSVHPSPSCSPLADGLQCIALGVSFRRSTAFLQRHQNLRPGIPAGHLLPPHRLTQRDLREEKTHRGYAEMNNLWSRQR